MIELNKKRRMNREYQAKHRGSKIIYKNEIENLQTLFLWEAGELSEGQAMKRLGLNRLALRELRNKYLDSTV